MDDVDQFGNTALTYAAANAHHEATRKLLAAGANVNHVNKEYGGKSAMDYARESREPHAPRVVHLLEAAVVAREEAALLAEVKRKGGMSNVQQTKEHPEGSKKRAAADKVAAAAKAEKEAETLASAPGVLEACFAKSGAPPKCEKCVIQKMNGNWTPRPGCGSEFALPSELFRHQGGANCPCHPLHKPAANLATASKTSTTGRFLARMGTSVLSKPPAT